MRLSIVLGLCLALAPASVSHAKAGQEPDGAASKQTKRERASKDKAPCYAPEVRLTRKRGTETEERSLSLTFCDGAPNPKALESLSVLARPRDVERPDVAEIRAYQRRPIDRGPKEKRRDPAYLSAGVIRLDPGLLVRLERVAKRFPGKDIEIVSGHRPDARTTSRHHHGRALDLRVAGVSREALRDFLRSFPETGVGYYPNSVFVHMDVREDKGYWVDRSGPGEAPDYGPWPPPKKVIERESRTLLGVALSELESLEIGKIFAKRAEGPGERSAGTRAATRPQTKEQVEPRTTASVHGPIVGREPKRAVGPAPLPQMAAHAAFQRANEPAHTAAHITAQATTHHAADEDEDIDLQGEELERLRREVRASLLAL